jgi:hypothetical protein
MTQDMLKERISLLEELMKQKISQASSLKESLKPIEAFSSATKEMSKKIEEIVNPKKHESLELLSRGKMTGESYKFLIEILDQLTGLARHSRLDSEKLLSSKQNELNFVAHEFNKLKELQAKFASGFNKPEQHVTEEKKEEAKVEYVRSDQNPNTRIGKAALDIQQRKKTGKAQEEEA